MSIAFFTLGFAQDKTVSGVVKDGSLPLPGVNVTVKGTNVGTATDFDGKYSIKVAEGQTLVFTFLGYATQSIKVGSSSTINVALAESAESLENVIIDVGFVNSNRNKINTAVAVVSGKELEKFASTTTIDNALQGKVAGVQVVAASGRPGQAARVVIRGANGPDGSSNPLYVVDGMYMTANEMTALNPADIETQVVLKDAAAAAMFGARGGSGVIVITTKKGKVGKTQFSINTSYGVTERVDDNFDMMNAQQYLELGDKYRAAGIGSVPTFTTAERAFRIRNGANWEEEIFRKGQIKTTQFQVTSADENTNFLASFVADSNDGLVRPWNGQERLSGRIKVDRKLKHGMSIGANIGMSYQSDDRPRESFNVLSPIFTAYSSSPIISKFVINPATGQPQIGPNGSPIYSTGGLPNNFSYFDIYENYFITTRQFRNFGGVYFNVDNLFIDGLTFRSDLSAIYNRNVSETFIVPGSNIASAFGLATGSKTDAGFDDFEYTWINTLNYNKKFSDKHEVQLTLFTELNKENFYQYSLESIDYPNGFLQVQSLSGTPTEAFTNRSDALITGGGFSGTYTYGDRYTVTAAIRRDGNSRFGENSRYGNFPAVSVGWTISNEKFMQNSKYIDNWRLRASYGESGQTTGIGQTYPTTNVVFPTYNNLNGAAPSGNFASPDLGWAVRTSRSIGTELSAFKGRLNMVLEYFYDTRSEFYFTDNLPSEGGAYFRTINAGKFTNKGWEATVNAVVLKAKDFTWSVNANFTDVKSIVNDINGLDFLQAGGSTRNVVGQYLNAYFLNRYAGVNPANGEPLYYTATGDITNRFDGADAVVLGDKTPQPTFYGGFGTTINYKNIDISADFAFQGGNYIYNIAELFLMDPTNYNTSNMRVEASNFWTTPGQTNVLPRPINDDNTVRQLEFTDQFLQRGDFIRFRTLNIGYTFGKETFGKFPVDKVRIYFQGQNLHTWTNFNGDPEVGFIGLESTDAVAGAAYRWAYPNAKVVSFGTQINF